MQEEINIIENYKNVVLDLSEILEEENAFLTEYKMKEAKNLLKAKEEAVIAYRSVVAYLIKNPQELEQMSVHEKTKIKEISFHLDDLLKENDIIIKTRMETSKSVMDSIVNLIKISNVSNSTSYGSHGTMSPLEKGQNSIALNQTL
ncbi:MAG: hypothetical protein PHE89_04560 [Alphaproteobacteria bacterium]|nr:hypothetical protein [Alphaproteobacteria bacterium]